MIEVRDLVKTFDGFAALRGATLTVPKGAVYGLVGPNGAGKSTLLRHITGVFRQDSGEVLVNGVPVYENRHVKENIVSIPDDWFYYTSPPFGKWPLSTPAFIPASTGSGSSACGSCFSCRRKRPSGA